MLTREIIQKESERCRREASKVRRAFANGAIKSWGNVAYYGFKVPAEPWGSMPMTYANLSAFLLYYEASSEERLNGEFTALQDTSVKNESKLDKDIVCSQFGNVTLLPEQESVFRTIYDTAIRHRRGNYFVQDAPAGAGKTFIALAIIAQAMKDGLHKKPENLYRLFPYVIITRASVVEQTKRVFEDAGLGQYLGTKILIINYSMLIGGTGKTFYSDVEDVVSGKLEVKWNPVTQPLILILDECHGVNRETSRQTEVLRAVMGSPQTVVIGLSATPASVLKDLCTLLIANKVQYGGLTARDQDTAEKILRMFDPTPAKPNTAAMKRIKPLIEPYMFRMPYVRWPFRGITRTVITDFATQTDREWYNFAHERWLEKRKALLQKGAVNGAFQMAIINNEFRRAVEPCRVPFFIERIREAKRRGDVAIAIGCAYKETLIRTVFTCVDEGIWSRKQISLIWGGSSKFKPELLLSVEEFNELLERTLTERPTADDILRLKETIRYWDDQKSLGITAEEQQLRHRKLEQLGLMGHQSRDQRQREIDKYQLGDGCPLCIFTLAAGGVGLSLHQHSLRLLPREGYFTPTYSGPEIKQALGRLPRRTSKSNTYQYLCWMKDTVEEYHVAPRIDAKLKCIDEITNRNFDAMDLLAAPVDPNVRPKFRNLEEAKADAESEESQIRNFNVDDEDPENAQD